MMADPQEIIREGRAAERIMTDPAFVNAVEQADARIVRAWRHAETLEAREQAHAKQAALQEVLAQLRTIISDAEYEVNRTEGSWG